MEDFICRCAAYGELVVREELYGIALL